MGDIGVGALRAALSGDSSRLERVDNLDARIEALVEPRAKALERNAETLCSRMQALDRIDDALDYRHEGRPLELLRVETGDGATSADCPAAPPSPRFLPCGAGFPPSVPPRGAPLLPALPVRGLGPDRETGAQ